MTDRAWKREERRAAALFHGWRFPANSGGPADFETATTVGQVKHVRRLALTALETLAVDMARIGEGRTPPKAGVVVVKRQAGRGQPTPRLVVVTETVWRRVARTAAGMLAEPAE